MLDETAAHGNSLGNTGSENNVNVVSIEVNNIVDVNANALNRKKYTVLINYIPIGLSSAQHWDSWQYPGVGTNE